MEVSSVWSHSQTTLLSDIMPDVCFQLFPLLMSYTSNAILHMHIANHWFLGTPNCCEQKIIQKLIDE